MSLRAQGRHPEAADLLRRALPRASGRDAADLHQALAVLLMETRSLDQALYHAQRAAELAPHEPRLRCLHALSLLLQEKFSEALAAYESALADAPTLAEAWGGAANCHVALDNFPQAEHAFANALRLSPSDPTTLANFAKFCKQTGRPDDAARLYREALRRGARDPSIIAELAYAMTCSSLPAPEETFGAHRLYGDALSARNPGAPTSPRDPDRPLTVGFVSADFREHSIAYFFEPLLEGLDRAAFRPILYDAGTRHDTITTRLRALAPCTSIAELDDNAAAAGIRADAVDILVDLSGLTRGSRLPLFARRPAPLQLHYLGYANTTGLAAIDARIVDSITDPPGAERLATEKLLRLPRCFLCYRPPAEAPEPAAPPSDSPITFGSFNNIFKLSDAAIALWSRVLAAVPDSRLAIKSRGLDIPFTRDLITARFEKRSIARDRLDILPPAPATREHLALYSRISIALDPFPYHGTTTTCEALHMGVPVVSLAGHAHASRVGLSILSAVGLADLAPDSPERFVEVAASLAADAPRRADLRRTLRARLAASSLRDEAAFCRDFAALLRAEWRERCTPR